MFDVGNGAAVGHKEYKSLYVTLSYTDTSSKLQRYHLFSPENKNLILLFRNNICINNIFPPSFLEKKIGGQGL